MVMVFGDNASLEIPMMIEQHGFGDQSGAPIDSYPPTKVLGSIPTTKNEMNSIKYFKLNTENDCI